MPLFDYRCTECELTIELLIPSCDVDKLKRCVFCNSAMDKVISGSPLIDLKGDGFYKAGIQ